MNIYLNKVKIFNIFLLFTFLCILMEKQPVACSQLLIRSLVFSKGNPSIYIDMVQCLPKGGLLPNCQNFTNQG